MSPTLDCRASCERVRFPSRSCSWCSHRRSGGRLHSPATYGALWREAVSVRLYYLDGGALTRYRLVYESPNRSCHYFLVSLTGKDVLRTFVPAAGPPGAPPPPRPGTAALLPDGLAHDVSEHATTKVFEVVEGALLEGVAAAGAPVELAADANREHAP